LKAISFSRAFDIARGEAFRLVVGEGVRLPALTREIHHGPPLGLEGGGFPGISVVERPLRGIGDQGLVGRALVGDELAETLEILVHGRDRLRVGRLRVPQHHAVHPRCCRVDLAEQAHAGKPITLDVECLVAHRLRSDEAQNP
jgi:hypothetical protein